MKLVLEKSTYINQEDKNIVNSFLLNKSIKKYILGINKYTKAIQKYIEVDGIIDDFTRVQKSRKKEVLSLEQVPKDAIILWTSQGSPLEVKNRLDCQGYKNISYLSLVKYSKLNLPDAPFIVDFKDDFKNNYEQYQETFNLLNDDKSKKIFIKLINFKITFDYKFMKGFTNNFEEQYFDKDLIPKIDNIVFVDGGGYVGDTIPFIVNYFPNFKKIYVIEPSKLHIGIAKRDFGDNKNIEFIECGLSNKVNTNTNTNTNIDSNICNHNFQAIVTNTIDNLFYERNVNIDFIKLDIEGDEQDAIEGATKTIKKYTPILAICIYHKAEDWYKIPKKVLAINPNYKIYLRHYMEGIYETVMYFIPIKIKL